MGAIFNEEDSAATLSKESLEEFLKSEFTAVDRGQGAIPKEVCFRILSGIPRLRLGKDEIFVLSAALGINRKGTLGWRDFLPSAYVTLGSISLVRFIGRRLTMAFSSLDSDRMDFVTTLPLRKLAERLLHVVKLVDRDGECCLEFPAAEVYFQSKEEPEHSKDDEEEVEEMCFATLVTLPVVGRAGVSEADCWLNVAVVSSSWKAKVYAAIEVTQVHCPELEGLPLPVQEVLFLPSVLSVDEEEAREYIQCTLRSFCLDYRDETFTRLCVSADTEMEKKKY